MDEKGSLKEIPEEGVRTLKRVENACPECGQEGKVVDTATVKAQLSISLRQIKKTLYLFCRSHTCPVVYFSSDGEQVFTVEQVRERVYQKEPESNDVFVCYCFQHTAGEVRTANPESRASILEDINAGIKGGQCACDLRNPQGSCCLGNVREAIKRAESLTITTV